jgi:hypothetical protein
MLGSFVGEGGVDWIRLAQDVDRWRAVVNAVMNLRVLAPRSNNEIEFHIFFPLSITTFYETFPRPRLYEFFLLDL